MTNTLFGELEAYLRRNFPQSDLLRADWPILHQIHVRYELGDPFENGTDERIQQVNSRVMTIIQDCFESEDSILLLVNDRRGPDLVFGNTTPEYLYELIDKKDLNRSDQRMLEHPLDEEEEGEPNRNRFRQLVVPTSFGRTNYKAILAGIANYEQGREPGIGQDVYFLAPDKDIVFYMYDDRGCVVFSDSPRKIMHIYTQYNDWLVDYWRETIDEVFKELR